VTVLLTGRFHIHLPGAAFILGRPGDYVVIPPNVSHTWKTLADSTVLTVRWAGADPAPNQGARAID
jgi:quercetin dioxygenase-like cupin family protein